jgi:hypothetical protein
MPHSASIPRALEIRNAEIAGDDDGGECGCCPAYEGTEDAAENGENEGHGMEMCFA